MVKQCVLKNVGVENMCYWIVEDENKYMPLGVVKGKMHVISGTKQYVIRNERGKTKCY